jgi:hypothetical protein
LRLALCGPAGSGKTYTLLSLATELGGPIAYVDTEHGSASKYADLFAFDVIEPDEFDPRKLVEFIGEAAKAGYRSICIDSLSHYWMGKGGELEMVDNVAKRSQSGNSFAAWKNVTPHHNALVDTIIAAPLHVLVSMRTKTEWVIEEVGNKKVPRKVGLAPVMRDGIEFEFDVCGDLDQDNTLTVSKSRCPDLAGKVINRPGKAMAQVLNKWLAGAPAEQAPATAAQPKPQPASNQPIDIGGNQMNTQAAADYVAQQKIAALKEKEAAKAPYQGTTDDLPAALGGPPDAPDTTPARVEEMRQRQAAPPEKPWTTYKGMLQCFSQVKAALHTATGDDNAYYGDLDLYGVKHANAFNKSADAIACYGALMARIQKREVAA